MRPDSDQVETVIAELDAFRDAFFDKHKDVLNYGNAGMKLDDDITQTLDYLRQDLASALSHEHEYRAENRAAYAANTRCDLEREERI